MNTFNQPSFQRMRSRARISPAFIRPDSLEVIEAMQSVTGGEVGPVLKTR